MAGGLALKEAFVQLLKRSKRYEQLRRAYHAYRGTLLPVYVEDPVDVAPRWGYAHPAHRQLSLIVNANRARYTETLERFVALRPRLRQIGSAGSQAPHEPDWDNYWFGRADAVALYGMLTQVRPERYVEIGSGNSTMFARRAIEDQALPTRITSIDPQPREYIDPICDQVIRQPLEKLDLSLFDELQAGDILFLDGSHRALTNSDATVFFLEVLPKLRPGILVHIHDVFLPFDYPPEWTDRYYSEQYLLAAFLLAESGRVEIVLPNHFVSRDPELAGILRPVWEALPPAKTTVMWSSFWIRVERTA
jgi:predicted O-methyltransferase YrrM